MLFTKDNLVDYLKKNRKLFDKIQHLLENKQTNKQKPPTC